MILPSDSEVGLLNCSALRGGITCLLWNCFSDQDDIGSEGGTCRAAKDQHGTYAASRRMKRAPASDMSSTAHLIHGTRLYSWPERSFTSADRPNSPRDELPELPAGCPGLGRVISDIAGRLCRKSIQEGPFGAT